MNTTETDTPGISSGIHLLTGDPLRTKEVNGRAQPQPGSFSRFVLPFPYQLQRTDRPAKPSDFCWVEAEKNDWLYAPAPGTPGVGRRDYLTRETHEILHRRARWFVLRGKAEEEGRRVDFSEPGGVFSFDFHPSPGRSVRVCVRAPALVLMEQPILAESPPDEPLSLGFLIWETFFPEDEAATLEDLLELNERFRFCQRLWNPWWWMQTLADLPVDLREPGATIRQRALRVNPETKREELTEDATSLMFARWAWLVECPLMDGPGEKAGAFSLVPPEQRAQARRWANHEVSEGKPDRGWLLHADNRAFVWTCALTDDIGLLERLKRADGHTEQLPEGLGAWVKFLNIDPSPRPKNPADAPGALADSSVFERQWAAERTYLRWASEGTLYGYNVHSGAMLGPNPGTAFTWLHFGGQYFDQLLLMLYLRTVLFFFSWQLHAASARVRDLPGGRAKEVEKFQGDFEQLRFDFALFTNLYQFPLISNQQQGLEMYGLLRRFLDVEDLFEEVEAEIKHSDEFLTAYRQRRESDTVLAFTVVGGLMAVVFIALTLLSNSSITDHFKGTDKLVSWDTIGLWAAVFLVFGGCLVWLAFCFSGLLGRWLGRCREWCRDALRRSGR